MTLQFTPDLDPTTPSIFLDVQNAVPTVKGYRGASTGINTAYSSLATDVRSIANMRLLDNSRRLFVGLQTKIWEGSGGAWTDRSGGAYDIGTETRWSFAQFGNYSLAVAKTVNLQASASGAFSTVAGAPKATHMATSQGFVMLADTNDGTYGDQSDRWWCSAQYDHTSWTPSVTTQATTGRLADTPGPITAMVAFGGGFVAFKENSMYVGTYTGAPAVFSWQLIPGEVGCRSKDAIISVGSAIYFLGNDNFYGFDGSRPVAIGNPLREWFFFSESSPAYRYKTIATYDRPNQLAWWFYVSNTGAGALNKALCYHVPTQRWGSMTVSVEAAAIYLSDPVTYDGLGALYATYDDLPANISYDSPFWNAESQVVAIANTSHTLQTLSGSSSSSVVTTGSVGDPEQRTLVRRIRPRFSVSPTSATLQHQFDLDYGDDWTNGPSSTLTNGSFDVLSDGRWHREVMTINGPWEMIDYKVMLQPTGAI